MANGIRETNISKSAKTLSGVVGLASAFLLLTAPGILNAGSFTLDGVKNNANDVSYSTSFMSGWYNGHQESNSDYMKTGSHETTVYYGEGTDAAGDSTPYSWLFLEVPINAKTMVWGDEFLIPGSDFDEYNPHYTTHHSDLTKLNFGDATGSEKVIFGNSGDQIELNLAAAYKLDKDGIPKPRVAKNDSPWTIIDVRDSVDYLVGAGSSECGAGNDPVVDCGARARTMSFEIKFAALTSAQRTSLFSAITSNELEFHLSPERRGDDIPPIPVPAAFWLFGTALVGFIGMSRRTSLS